MKKRQLGKTDLQVTEIGLGTNAVGGYNLFDDLKDEDGIAAVRRAFDLGINFFDTAETGARHPEEVEEKVGVVAWNLVPEELARIDELTLGSSF